MPRWLSGIIDVREGERASTAAMFIYILLIITVLVIVKSVRQSLFLQSFGAANLPYVYLLIALVAGGVAAFYQHFSRGYVIHRLVMSTIVVLIVSLVVLRYLMTLQWVGLAYVFYVWVAIYGILTTAQFWLFANYIYDPRQAKRLFVLLGLGATLGGIVGGYLTQLTVREVGTENLLLVAAVLLLGCGALVVFIGRHKSQEIREAARSQRLRSSTTAESASGFRLIWESRYLKLIMAIIALSIIIATVVDNQFSFVVEEHFPSKDGKTAFFGQFFTWLGWISFLTQLIVTGRLLRRFGVGVTMAVLPVALLLGSGAFLIVPVLVTGVLVKLADGAFRYTTHTGSLELLFLPIPIAVKDKTKTFIDMFTDRFSKGIAALLVILITTVWNFHYSALSWVLMGLSLVWVGVTVIARREYVAAFRESLLRRRLDEDALIITRADAETIGALAESLAQARGLSIERTLAMVEGIQSPLLIEPLILHAHSSDPQIASLALDQLADQTDPIDHVAIRDLLTSPDVEITSRALRILCSESGVLSALKLGPYYADDRAAVRLGAIMCSIVWEEDEAMREVRPDVLEQFLVDSGRPEDRQNAERMLAKLLRVIPSVGEISEPYILRFVQSDDPEVRDEAIKAAARLTPPSTVKPLIQLLQNRRIRFKVRDALVAHGDSALDELQRHFRDPGAAFAVRQYIPRVLERISVQRSVDILIDALGDQDERLRFAALRSLGRLRSRHPDLKYTNAVISKRLNSEIRKAYRYRDWVHRTSHAPESALLLKTLTEKQSKTTDRMFRLLAMLHPPGELYAASRALRSPNSRVRANALEYLDNILNAPEKQWVLGLVEDRPQPGRSQHVPAEFGEDVVSWPDVLERQARGDDDWLAACALYTIWAIRQQSLYYLISENTRDEGNRSRPLVSETIFSLRERLGTIDSESNGAVPC